MHCFVKGIHQLLHILNTLFPGNRGTHLFYIQAYAFYCYMLYPTQLL